MDESMEFPAISNGSPYKLWYFYTLLCFAEYSFPRSITLSDLYNSTVMAYNCPNELAETLFILIIYDGCQDMTRLTAFC